MLRVGIPDSIATFTRTYTEADPEEQLGDVSIHEDGRAEVTDSPVLGLPWQRSLRLAGR